MAVRINEAYGCEGEHDETIVAKSAESNLKKDSAILSFFKWCRMQNGDRVMLEGYWNFTSSLF